MRLLTAVVTAAVLVAPAAAQPARGAGCGKVTVVLHTVVDASPIVDYALPYGLLVDVVSANSTGHAYLKAKQPITVIVGASTRVDQGDGRSLGELGWSDHVTVLARVCASKLARGATPVLRATRVMRER